MRMKKSRRWLSALLAILMLLTMIPTVAFAADGDTSNDDFVRIFHLDCGRKYFSVDQIKAIVDTLAENHYTHLELAIGNDGLRFLLDDMSVTANDTTYTSDAVKAGIQAGNKAYYNAGTYNELTQTEMDTIISYAKEKGIGIIPLLNSPGHMDAILDCMESVGISNPAYSNSARTVDVTNTEAVAFTQALIGKYITYFAGKGCTYFNLGCDEYANDVSNSGFAGLISSGKYGNFITYVNNLATQVKNAKMTPMAFNDGIYYNSNTSSGTFDTDIVIAYWTCGWNGYSPASASFLAEKGHKIISTNDAWYYVLGRQAGNSSGYTIATAQNGVQNTACTDIPGDNDPTAAGCMICLWCDTPSASYSSTEVSNVTNLISTFATNNSTYFAASSDSGDTGDNTGNVEVTENETITVTVGGNDERTIDNANYEKLVDRTELNTSIATVEVTGTDATEATPTYTQVSVTCNTLISSNSDNWKATDYYYKADDGSYYPLYAKRSTESSYGGFRVTYKYTYGYSTDGGSNVSQCGTQEYAIGTISGGQHQNVNIDLYTKSEGTGTPASTTVTFTGVAVGTTYVTVGNTRYTIKVIAEDLSTVTPLTVEYWITNLPVTADGATSKAISAQSAYGEAGVDISTLVPETGTYAYGSVVFWKGTVLDSSNKQTTASGAENDKTGSGKDFNLIRYYNGSWQYFYEADGTWNTISSTDQVVIYWLQPTEVTKEITTLVKDWGYSPSNQQGDNNNKVALTVAVVYPDGTVSPAEGDMYSNSTTLFNYWNNRDIGLVAPVNNSDYEISKITVTDGTRDQSGTGQWGANDTITWEKVTNEAGKQWYNETTYWDETVGGTPMVNGVTSNITWSNYNTAKLVLIYLKPIHYDTNLIVNWVDDNANSALISTMEVAVSSDGTPITFYNGLKQTSALPTEGVGGTFTLDDDAYVTNSSNVNQTFNKNISTVPGVADQYKSGLYQYVSADLSADGMTLTLHYNIDNSKLSKTYVLDFGLPVEVPLSDLVNNPDDVSEVELSVSSNAANAAYDDSSKKITFTPAAVMTGTTTITATLTIGSKTSKFTIGFVPASNVLYEDGFLTESTEENRVAWTGSTDNKVTNTQTTGKGHVDGVVDSDPYVYGYDPAYSTSTGNSNGTAWTVSGLGSTAQSTNALTTTFKGNGFDLIGSCGPTTGLVYVVLKDSSNKSVKGAVIDTSFNDSAVGIISQVPLAHLMLDKEDTYTATVRGYYRKGTASDSGTNAASTFSARASTVDTSVLDAVLEDIYEDDLDDLEMIYFDSDSVLAAYNGAAMYALNDGGDTDTTSTTVEKQDGTTVTIDGFRVYKGTSEAYISSEQNVTYTNVLDAVQNETFAAYIENNSSDGTGYTKTTYEAAGGPQNEIYLANGQSVAFAVTGQTPIQISARAVDSNKQAKIAVNSTVDGETLASNTEMYYEITPVNNVVTIKNTGEGLLALGNLKMQETKTTLRAMTDSDLQVAYAMLRTMSVEPEPEPEPEPEVFTPNKFDIKVTSTKVIRNKVVNLTVTTSTDVEYLMVNGKKVKPSNSLLVKWGISKNYVFVVSDIVKRDAVQNYTIQAYNADGLASAEYTAEG